MKFNRSLQLGMKSEVQSHPSTWDFNRTTIYLNFTTISSCILAVARLRFRFMAPKAITLIRQVDKVQNDYRMKLSIIRLWKLPSFTNPAETFAIEMVLMDEEGSKIQGNVLRKWVMHFEKLLNENATFYIDSSLVGINDSKYKYVETPYKLTFSCETKLKKCTDFSGPLYGFSFASYQSILDRTIPDEQFVDVIGHVVKMYELEKVTVKRNQVTERLNLDVQDLVEHQVRMTLWGEFAKQMVAYVSKNLDKGVVIIILQFGKLKFYRELPHISNLFGVSRLIINGNLDEITEFRTRLVGKSVGNETITPTRTISSIVHTLSDEFLNTYESISIARVSDVTTERKTIVVGTIKHIANNLPWYYVACNMCGHKVVEVYDVMDDSTDRSGELEEKKILACTNSKCKATEITPVPRFKVQVRVEDCTGFVYDTPFDRDVVGITQTTARELAKKHQPVDDANTLPVELDVLLEKKFAFLIDITTYNFPRNCSIYGVLKVTANEGTICELERRLGTHEDIGSSGLGNAIPVSAVEATIGIPSNAKDKAPMIMPTHRTSKRYLNKVYDAAETPTGSSTKQSSSLLTERAGATEETKGMKKA